MQAQLYQHFARCTHTISAEGCTSKSEIATFTSVSRDGHARSLQRVALRNQKSQLYQRFVRWTRAISAEGCASKSEIATLPAFRAMDTRDLRRGLHCETKKCNLTSIPRTRHARSPQRVHGFTCRNHASEVLRLPRNHEPRSHAMLHWPRKSIIKMKFQKCNISQELSPLTSKYRVHGADCLRLPCKTQSFE